MDVKIDISNANKQLKVHDTKIWNGCIVRTVSIGDNFYMVDAEGYIIFRAFRGGIFPSTLQEALTLGCSVPIKGYKGLWKVISAQVWNSQIVYLMAPDEKINVVNKELNLIMNEEGNVITVTLDIIGLAELERFLYDPYITLTNEDGDWYPRDLFRTGENEYNFKQYRGDKVRYATVDKNLNLISKIREEPYASITQKGKALRMQEQARTCQSLYGVDASTASTIIDDSSALNEEQEQEQLYRVTYTYHGKAPREDIVVEDVRKLITDGLLRPEVEAGPDQDLLKLCEVYVALLMQSGCDDTTIFQLITEWLGNEVYKDESQECLEEQAKLLLQWAFACDVQKADIEEVIRTNGTNNSKSTK